MAAIYLFSALIGILFFLNGYSRYCRPDSNASRTPYLFLFAPAILLRVFFLSFAGFTLTGLINGIFDLASAILLIFLLTRITERGKAIFCAAFFLLNPVVLFYSCVSGKLISPFTFFIILMFFAIRTKNIVFTFFFYGVAVIFYPDFLLFAPFLLLVTILMLREKTPKHAIIVFFSSCLVFSTTLFLNYFFLDRQFFSSWLRSAFSPAHVCENACNFWSMTGHDFLLYPDFFGKFDPRLLSVIILATGLLVAGRFILQHENVTSALSILPGALLYLLILFLFFPGMEETFLYPAVLISFFLFCLNRRHASYRIFLGLSLLHFLNLVFSYDIYEPELWNSAWYGTHPLLILTSFATVVLTLLVLLYFFSSTADLSELEISSPVATEIKSTEESVITEEPMITKRPAHLDKVPWSRKDAIFVSVLMLAFGILVFFRLGHDFAPETTYMATASNPDIILTFDKDVSIDHVSFFLSRIPHCKFSVSSYDSAAGEWKVLNESAEVRDVFTWNKMDIKSPVQSLGLVCLVEEADINELVIVDTDGNVVTPTNAADYPGLFDEQSLFPKVYDYRYGTMFDEIYHARTAYEFIHGDITYETTHPPLGKVMMEAGILLFGMNPFGWRFMSAIMGILCIPVMYLLARKLFRTPVAAFVTTLLFVADFMHYAVSRIATVDIYVAFFILLMSYFMYCYLSVDFYRTPLWKTLIPLGACGITMGLAISTKWTGLYAAVGLAIFFFYSLGKRFQEYLAADAATRHELAFYPKAVKTLLFCLVFFIGIPVLIYFASFFQFVPSIPADNYLAMVFDNIKFGFSYHSKLVADHPYGSAWYEWPFIRMPLLYVFDNVNSTDCSCASCFGNPVIWWPGVFCILYMFHRWISKKDGKAAFIAISYAVSLIPWMYVTRVTFIYHYFPCAMFLILAVGYTLQLIYQKFPRGKYVVTAYCILAVLIFALFFPVISGIPLNRNLGLLFLRWLKSWVLL